MRAAPRLLVLVLPYLFAASVSADPIPPSGPLACYVGVQASSQLAQSQAKELCIGAPSVAPAQCFEAGVAGGTLTQYQAIQLCTGTSSLEPAECAASLRETSGLTTAYIVSFCAALQWPQVPPPEGGSAECLDAVRRTGITDTQAIDVCRGSRGTEPAECLIRGRELTGLVDQDLVDLCTRVIPYPPYPGSVASYPGPTRLTGPY